MSDEQVILLAIFAKVTVWCVVGMLFFKEYFIAASIVYGPFLTYQYIRDYKKRKKQ